MSFNFAISTNAMFGAGKLNELHTQINTLAGAVHGKRRWSLSPTANPPEPTAIWIGWKMN